MIPRCAGERLERLEAEEVEGRGGGVSGYVMRQRLGIVAVGRGDAAGGRGVIRERPFFAKATNGEQALLPDCWGGFPGVALPRSLYELRRNRLPPGYLL